MTEGNIHKHYKEEMVQGFTGMQHKHHMLLLAIFYNQVFYF